MINIAVEGESDREMAKAVVRAAGRTVGLVRAAGGTSRLDPLIEKYAKASRRQSWVVFRDSDGRCPVALQELLVPLEAPTSFALRIAHTMTEAWLMADRLGFADYFSLSADRVPTTPELLHHAKRSLLDLCSGSRSRAIRSEVVGPGGGVGPLYVSRLNDFASSRWSVVEASENSQSLARAVDRIGQLSL